MGQRPNDAAVMDAQNLLCREVCALSMGQRSNDAVLKDVKTILGKEECVLGMGTEHFVIPKLGLLRLVQNSK